MALRTLSAVLLCVMLALTLGRQTPLSAQEVPLAPIDNENTPEPTAVPSLEIFPATIKLLSPAHRSTLYDQTVTFSWTETPSTRWYRLQIYGKNGQEIFRRKLRDTAVSCSSGVCSISLSDLDLQNDKRYSWRIVAKTANGTRIRSDKNRFHVNTASDFEAEPQLQRIYKNKLKLGLASTEQLSPQWPIVIRGTDFALNVTESDTPTYIWSKYQPEFMSELVTQAKVHFSQGSVKLSTTSYTAELSNNGQVNLYRQNELIQSGTINSYEPQPWHKLRLSVTRHSIRVAVDGTDVLTYQDAAFLPAMTPHFSGHNLGETGLQVDNIQLWVTSTTLMPETMMTASPYPLSSGETFVFTGIVPNFGSGIVVYDALGSHLLLKYDTTPATIHGTTLPLTSTSSPVLSRDGSKIGFVCVYRIGTQLRSEVCVGDVDLINYQLTNIHNITNNAETDRDSAEYIGGWSPTENKLLFSAPLNWSSTGPARHYVYDAATGDIQPVGDFTYNLDWGNDGKIYSVMGFVPEVIVGQNSLGAVLMNPSTVNLRSKVPPSGTIQEVVDVDQYPFSIALQQCYEQWVYRTNQIFSANANGDVLVGFNFLSKIDFDANTPCSSGQPSGHNHVLYRPGEMPRYAASVTSGPAVWSPVTTQQYAVIATGNTVNIYDTNGNALQLQMRNIAVGNGSKFDWIKLPSRSCDAIIRDDAALRLEPSVDGMGITTLRYGQAVRILGVYTSTSSPYPDNDPSTPELVRWWLIWVIDENTTERPQGWVWEGLVEGDTVDCVANVPELPPNPVPPSPPPGLCLIKLRETYVSSQIVGNNLLTASPYYASSWDNVAIGSVVGLDDSGNVSPAEREAVFLVYGVHAPSDSETYYLISPVGLRQPAEFLRYKPTLPTNTNYVQNWVNKSHFQIVSPDKRACETNVVGRLPEYFRISPDDRNYANSLGFYLDRFLAPVDRATYTNYNYNQPGNYYNAFRVSQELSAIHPAVDIVFQPPDGRNRTSINFPVYTPFEGVVLEAGPDSITGTEFYTGAYGNFPSWVKDTCPEGNTANTCYPINGGYFVQFYYVDRIGLWQLMVALKWETDEDPNTTQRNEVSNSGFMPSSILDRDRYGNLVRQANAGALTRCGGFYGCAEGPGRQLLIWHEAGDGDASPDIETAYVHVNITSAQYQTWRQNCSAPGNGTRSEIWRNVNLNHSSPCWVNQNVYLGEAQLIGFTTGTHLHYSVSVDLSNDQDSNDIFDKPIGFIGERVDPLLSVDLHMEPGKGGSD